MRNASARLRRAQRLRKSKDFHRVAQRGERKASTHFIVVLAEDRRTAEGPGPALGVTVSRKVGSAVERNRVKRRIREWFRRHQGELSEGAEVVVIARRGAASLGQRETDTELGSLLP